MVKLKSYVNQKTNVEFIKLIQIEIKQKLNLIAQMVKKIPTQMAGLIKYKNFT